MVLAHRCLAIACLASALFMGCGSHGPGHRADASSAGAGGAEVAGPGGGGAAGQQASSRIGPEGGTLSSSDGALTVTVPKGALSSPTAITIAPIPEGPEGMVGAAFELGPSGLTFASAVQLTFKLAAGAAFSRESESMVVTTFFGGEWRALPASAVDESGSAVVGLTGHFSKFAVKKSPNGYPQSCHCDKEFKACVEEAGGLYKKTPGGEGMGTKLDLLGDGAFNYDVCDCHDKKGVYHCACSKCRRDCCRSVSGWLESGGLGCGCGYVITTARDTQWAECNAKCDELEAGTPPPAPLPPCCEEGQTLCGQSCCGAGVGCVEGKCQGCGDGVCDPGETALTCAQDCSVCGDGLCVGAETVSTCPLDCAVCGDKFCTGAETALSCPLDCAVCGDGICSPPEQGGCPADCPACGDGYCSGGETAASCPKDCLCGCPGEKCCDGSCRPVKNCPSGQSCFNFCQPSGFCSVSLGEAGASGADIVCEHNP